MNPAAELSSAIMDKITMLPKNRIIPLSSQTEKHRPESIAPTDSGQDLTDIELVALVKKRIAWASETLVRRYYNKARALAHQMCDKGTNEAEDMTQQAFLNALKNIDKFKGTASFKTWFYRILINTCLDARRRRKRWLGIFTYPFSRQKDGETTPFSFDAFPDKKNTANPELILQTNQLHKDIQHALGKLPEKQRLVFQLKVLQELTVPEISEILSLAPGTVKSHLFRATKAMRYELAEWAGR